MSKTYITSRARREFVQRSLAGVGVGMALPLFLQKTATALAAGAAPVADKYANRILLVIELDGGCDGLDTVVPHGHDEYYKLRPTIGIANNQVRKLNDEFGFHPSFVGTERLFKDGKMAIVHGCGYANPNFSHFKSMEFWHTGAPNAGESLGWVGRTLDAMEPEPKENIVVNLNRSMKLAVQSSVHAPIVFNQPDRFTREGIDADEEKVIADVVGAAKSDNPTLGFLRGISKAAAASSKLVQHACAEYKTQTNFGGYMNLTTDLRNVSALIADGFKTKIFYTSLPGWDTHSNQPTARRQLMGNLDDGIAGFMEEMHKLGRADDVAIMVFTEFGRRVPENASGGTDHGTAAPMFLIGNKVKGGFYGQHPTLADLDNGNLKMTTDFRRVYATVIKEWLGYSDTQRVLKGDFQTLGAFA
ncbi:MAG TPA: DUF1501 domain-containing protein [Lacipirellulaceae bacterium]